MQFTANLVKQSVKLFLVAVIAASFGAQLAPKPAPRLANHAAITLVDDTTRPCPNC